MQLKQKVVVITGGTSGIGRSMVTQLAKNNTVIVIGRNESKLEKLETAYPELVSYQCNLAESGEVENTADQIARNHPQIDVLVNNAGVQHTPKFIDNDFRYETITQEINVNFGAICSFIYLLLPNMLDDNRRTAILNVNSGLGLAPKTNSAVYCATKGALNIFSWSLRYQLEPTNIKVLQSMLPLVDTAMTTGRGTGKLTSDVAAAAIIRGIEKEIEENFIGKAWLLKHIYDLSPALARRILKKY